MALAAEVLDRIPTEPGVYLFKDARGAVVYVGKDLRGERHDLPILAAGGPLNRDRTPTSIEDDRGYSREKPC